MVNNLEVTIDVIVHATEDISKIFHSFNEVLDIKEEEFSINETTGHFDNPITILNVKIIKNRLKILLKTS